MKRKGGSERRIECDRGRGRQNHPYCQCRSENSQGSGGQCRGACVAGLTRPPCTNMSHVQWSCSNQLRFWFQVGTEVWALGCGPVPHLGPYRAELLTSAPACPPRWVSEAFLCAGFQYGWSWPPSDSYYPSGWVRAGVPGLSNILPHPRCTRPSSSCPPSPPDSITGCGGGGSSDCGLSVGFPTPRVSGKGDKIAVGNPPPTKPPGEGGRRVFLPQTTGPLLVGWPSLQCQTARKQALRPNSCMLTKLPTQARLICLYLTRIPPILSCPCTQPTIF